MIDVKEIIEKHQKLIAQKYKLGNSLVTGHRKGYFDEASEEAIKEIVTEVLKEAAENAKFKNKKGELLMGYSDTNGYYFIINKESITSVINKVKF